MTTQQGRDGATFHLALLLSTVLLIVACSPEVVSSSPTPLGTRATASIDFGGQTTELCVAVNVSPPIDGAAVAITVSPAEGVGGAATVQTTTDPQGKSVASWPITTRTDTDWTVNVTVSTPAGPITATAVAGASSPGTGPAAPACAKGPEAPG